MGTSADTHHACSLSVAMIVRDEQDVLAGTLESVQDIADEVVVLDTGSSDRTPAIAQQRGARVIRFPWSHDFSAARNRCLEQVTSEWVLWLDAGERFEADAAAKLRAFVNAGADPQKVYMLMVENPPASPAASAEQAARLRLMPRLAGLRFAGHVRETLRPSLEAAGMATESLPTRILCHPRRNDPQRKARAARRNLELVAREKAANGHFSPRLLLVMGEAFGDLGDSARARPMFRRAVDDSPSGSTEMLEAYYGLLTSFDGDEGGQQQQLAVCAKALEVYPLDAQLLCALGNYLQNRGRVDLASRAFATAAQFGRIDEETWHLREIGEIATACLGLTLQLLERSDEARDVLDAGLRGHPGSDRLRRQLIAFHVKHGQADQALAAAAAMPISATDRERLCVAIRGGCEAAARNWGPALAQLQAAYVAGCEDPLCLRWLAVTLMANGHLDAVEPVLRRWQTAEPENCEVRTYLEALDAGNNPPAEVDQATPDDNAVPRQIRIDEGQRAKGGRLQPSLLPQSPRVPPPTGHARS